MSGYTTVLLTDAETWPLHGWGPGHGLPSRSEWQKWRGRAVTVCLPPQPPDGYWTCDTPLVWQLEQRSVEEVWGEPGRAFVCVHQIQAD